MEPGQMGESTTLILVSPFEEDRACLKRMLGDSPWRLCWAPSRQEALGAIRDGRIAVVISETDLPEGNWKDVLSQLDGVAHPPLLIVASRHADNRLWAEVLNLGGYDVLAKPFDGTEVVRVIRLACQQWQRDLGRKVSRRATNGEKEGRHELS